MAKIGRCNVHTLWLNDKPTVTVIVVGQEIAALPQGVTPTNHPSKKAKPCSY